MEDDYGDLDSEKVVLRFRGRGMDEEINCIDESLKELVARRNGKSADKEKQGTDNWNDRNEEDTNSADMGNPASDESDIEMS